MHFDDLPLEIIQYVFSLCCRSVVVFIIPQEVDRRRPGTTQVTLSLVCSRWREIALKTSALWGEVVVLYDAGREQARGPTASFQSVRDWLNRAGMTSVSTMEIAVHNALKSQIAAISQTLLSSVHVTSLSLETYYSFLLVPTTNSPRLERLQLSSYKPPRKTDAFPRLPEMPSLKELHLYLHPGNFVDLTNIYLIPWHQLRVFAVSGYYWSSQVLFNILQRCKSLVECALFVKLESGHQYNIVLPNLEDFALVIYSKGSVDPIIRSLTLQNLRSMDIKCWNRCTKLPFSTEAIVLMAQRSGFNKRLTDFSLCLTEQPVDVRSLLGSMLALKSVRLLGPLMFQPGIFDDLSCGTIGPQLEEIYFGVMNDEEIGLLLEAVGQRHKKAKTVSDIRRLVSVTSHCTRWSDFESHNQQAKQCSEAFDANVRIINPLMYPDALLTNMVEYSGQSDSDEESYLNEGAYIDEELGSIPGDDVESDV